MPAQVDSIMGSQPFVRCVPDEAAIAAAEARAAAKKIVKKAKGEPGYDLNKIVDLSRP